LPRVYGNYLDAREEVESMIKALRLVRAIMPTIIRGNTAVPTIMIAERAAEFIAQTSPVLVAIKTLVPGNQMKWNGTDGLNIICLPPGERILSGIGTRL